MHGQRLFEQLRSAVLVGALAFVTACSTVLYQADGQYTDDQNQSRKILLQWKAQIYYIPFVDADVDYGSVSLQAECLPDVFLDSRSNEQTGFVFVERPQDFKLAPGSPETRMGNFLVCASLASKRPISELSAADQARLQVLCEPKFNIPFLPPSQSGYELEINRAESGKKEIETLLCR